MIHMDRKSNEQKRWMSCAAGGKVFRFDWRKAKGKKPAVSNLKALVRLSSGLSNTRTRSSKKFAHQRARVMSKTSFKRETKKVHMEKKLKKHLPEFSKEISLLERDVEKAKKKISRKRLLEDIPWEERSRYKAQLRARRRKKKSRIALIKGITKIKTQQQSYTMKAENQKDSCSLNSVQQSTKNRNSSNSRTFSPKDQRSPSIIAPDFPIIDSSELKSKSESREEFIKSGEEIDNANQQSFKGNNENSQDDKVISLTPTNCVGQISSTSDSRDKEYIRSTPVTANIVKNEKILQLNGEVSENVKRTAIDLTSSPILSPKMKKDFTELSKRTQKIVSTLHSSEESKRTLSLQNFQGCRRVRLGSSYTVGEIREIMRVGGGRFGRHKIRATLDFKKLAEPARSSFHKHAKILIPIIRSLAKNGRFIKTIDRTSF